MTVFGMWLLYCSFFMLIILHNLEKSTRKLGIDTIVLVENGMCNLQKKKTLSLRTKTSKPGRHQYLKTD